MQNIIKLWNHCQKLHGFKSRWIHGKKKIHQRLLNKNMICGSGSDLATDCWKLGRFHRRIIPYIPYFLHLLYISAASHCQSYASDWDGSLMFGASLYLQQPSWRVDIWPGQACLVAILLRLRFLQGQDHFYCCLFLCLCIRNGICTWSLYGCCSFNSSDESLLSSDGVWFLVEDEGDHTCEAGAPYILVEGD